MNHLFTASIFVAIAMALSVPSPAVAQNFPPSVTQKIHAAQKQVNTIGLEEYRKVVESPGEAGFQPTRTRTDLSICNAKTATARPSRPSHLRSWGLPIPRPS